MVDLQSLVDTLSGLDEENLVNVISSVLQARPEVAPPVVNFSIPDLTYPPSKALLERRSQGVIKSFNQNNGFGFIDCPELHAVFGNDVFLHSKQIGDLGPGANVSFAVCLSKDNKPQAYDVQLLGGGKGGGGGGKGDYGCGMMGGMDGMGGCGMGGMGGKGNMISQAFDMMTQMQMMKGKGWSGGGCFGKGKMMEGKKGMFDKPMKRKEPPSEEVLAAMPEGMTPGQELGSFSGVIKSFNPKSGYGFITCMELQGMGFANDAFLHSQQLGNCEVGEEVAFTCYLNNKGQPQAKDVSPAGGGPAMKKLRMG